MLFVLLELTRVDQQVLFRLSVELGLEAAHAMHTVLFKMSFVHVIILLCEQTSTMFQPVAELSDLLGSVVIVDLTLAMDKAFYECACLAVSLGAK